MADRQVARLLQPWLLSSSLPTRFSASRPLLTASCRLGINTAGGSGSSSSNGTASASAMFANQQQRRHNMGQAGVRRNRETERRTHASGRKRKNDGTVPLSTEGMSVLIPMTFVTPPLSRYPRDGGPGKFLRFAYLAAKNRVMNYANLVGQKMLSKPSFTKGPRFKIRKSAVVPAAKALHIQMSEALARGDKEVLRRICTQELYQTLAGTIDARPKGQRTEWELVKYSGLGSTRLTDDKIALMPITQTDNRVVRQSVVSISSVQRMARYDDAKGGVKIPGSEKERHMLEYIVLTANVDHQKTWQQGEWKIWGTLPETTLESFAEETEMYQATADTDSK